MFMGKCPDCFAASSAYCCRHLFSARLLHKCAVAQGAHRTSRSTSSCALGWMAVLDCRERKQAYSRVYWKSCPCFVSAGFSVVLVWQRSWGRGDSFCCGCPALFVQGSNFSWDCSAERPSGLACFSFTGPNRAVNAASSGALQVSVPHICLMHLAELHSHSSPTFFFSLSHFLARGGPRMVVECENWLSSQRKFITGVDLLSP